MTIKKFLLMFMFIPMFSFGQSWIYDNTGIKNTVNVRGGYKFDSSMLLPVRLNQKPTWWNVNHTYDGAIQINSADGSLYWYWDNAWRTFSGGGGGGGVTSIAQGYGMTLSPNPIISTGTATVDTVNIVSKPFAAAQYAPISTTVTLTGLQSVYSKFLHSSTLVSPIISALTNGTLNDSLLVFDPTTGAVKQISPSRITSGGGADSSIYATQYRLDTVKANRVPYVGATSNVDLGVYDLTTDVINANSGVINTSSGSGVALSVSKGGAGEALTVVKSSGAGNAASITGGTTLIETLNLTNKLGDAYINGATSWNAKIGASDTASMLLPYLRKADTTLLNLSSRFALKANIADPTFTTNITTPNATFTSLSSGTTNDSVLVADASTGVVKRISSSRIAGGGTDANAYHYTGDAFTGSMRLGASGTGTRRLSMYINSDTLIRIGVTTAGFRWAVINSNNGVANNYDATVLGGEAGNASGIRSVVIGGVGGQAQGTNSISMSSGVAESSNSWAWGSNSTYANGANSVAFGNYANNANFTGAVSWADFSESSFSNNTANNQFMAKFAGGFQFKLAAAGTPVIHIKASGITNIQNVPTYADNTAALSGGLVAGDLYRTSTGVLMITY